MKTIKFFITGTNKLHDELEKLTAKFIGVEDALVFGMGFATNSLNLPALLSSDCLVVSNEQNHASIVLGLKISGASIKTFQHNDIKDLKSVIERSIIQSCLAKKPLKKILIVTEGIFSMDGTILDLPGLISVKKKFGAYIYIDEAHSIGAIGRRGRGITDFYGVDPKDIDILMGTFSKSFAASGSYIAGSKKLINFLRVNSHAQCYASSMSAGICQQIITSMKIIMGLDGYNDGKNRMRQLARNTKYFRHRLSQMGVVAAGHEKSPVVPVVVPCQFKLIKIVRAFRACNIAVPAAVYPATPICGSGMRFCISSAHTKEQLDYVLDNLEGLSRNFNLNFS